MRNPAYGPGRWPWYTVGQYQDTAARAEGITAHSEMLGEKQKAMKYREGLTVAIKIGRASCRERV